MNDLGFWKIVIMAAGIGLMLLLNIRYKINGLVALLLACLFVGVLEGLGLMKLAVAAATTTHSLSPPQPGPVARWTPTTPTWGWCLSTASSSPSRA